jgi:transposase
MRYMLTDELWAAMESLVRAAKAHQGRAPAGAERADVI